MRKGQDPNYEIRIPKWGIELQSIIIWAIGFLSTTQPNFRKKNHNSIYITFYKIMHLAAFFHEILINAAAGQKGGSPI